MPGSISREDIHTPIRLWGISPSRVRENLYRAPPPIIPHTRAKTTHRRKIPILRSSRETP